jgi:hypothetical protein
MINTQNLVGISVFVGCIYTIFHEILSPLNYLNKSPFFPGSPKAEINRPLSKARTPHGSISKRLPSSSSTPFLKWVLTGI